MTTYTRDEQKAIDGLRRSVNAIVALNEWNEGEQGAMTMLADAIVTFVTNRAIGRENEAVKPVSEPAAIEGHDSFVPEEPITPDGSEN